MVLPQFLYHYTSVDVLSKLFTNLKDGHFIFQASSVDSMNDSAEYVSTRKHCFDGVDEMIMEMKFGFPFELCFSE